MYVCICNAVTDKAIKTAVKNGDDTYERVCEKLSVASCCGRCRGHAHEVIAEARAECANSKLDIPLVFNPAGLCAA